MAVISNSGRRSGFTERPDYRVAFEPSPKRVRTLFNGATLADSTRVMLLGETAHLPVYYYPRDDVRLDLLEPSDHTSFCPFKGDCSYWHVTVDGRSAENAVWSYQDPFDEVAEIKDYMAFYWDRMDHWYEEDEEVFIHARDPRVRIDILESHRPVQVELGGEILAETRRARFLFETNLPTRYYIPAEDVRRDLFVASDSETACPYKGTARYWSVRLGERLHEDVVWSYPDPLPESTRIKDYLCFYNERVDAIRVDGHVVPKVRTQWSQD